MHEMAKKIVGIIRSCLRFLLKQTNIRDYFPAKQICRRTNQILAFGLYLPVPMKASKYPVKKSVDPSLNQ